MGRIRLPRKACRPVLFENHLILELGKLRRSSIQNQELEKPILVRFLELSGSSMTRSDGASPIRLAPSGTGTYGDGFLVYQDPQGSEQSVVGIEV